LAKIWSNAETSKTHTVKIWAFREAGRSPTLNRYGRTNPLVLAACNSRNGDWVA
jgi:hypothetical protein